MPFISIPNTLSVEMRATLFEQEVENTFYVQVPGGYAFADLESVGTIFETWADEFLSGLLPGSVRIDEFYIRGMENASDLERTVVLSPGIVGIRAGAGAPGNVTLAIKRLTGFTGRDHKGRIYLLGLSKNDVTGNVVAEDLANAWVETLDELTAGLLAEGYIASVVSKLDQGGLTPHGRAFAITNWAVTDFAVDSQRRRLAGRGS